MMMIISHYCIGVIPLTQTPTLKTPSIWQNSSLIIFWAGQGISLIGSAMAGITLPLLVLASTGSLAQMGVIAALSGTGALVASLISGLLADRVNRRMLLIICDTLNMLAYAAIPLTWFFFGPNLPLLYILSPLLGFLGITFFIGFSATVTNIVEREQLTPANSLLQGTSAFAGIVGPVLAGITIASIGAVAVMGLNAISFAVSVISLSFVRTTTASKVQERVAEKPGWVAAFLGGLRFIASNPTLRWMVIIRSGILVISSGSFAIILFRMRHDLGLSTNIIGIILGAGALGAVLSSFIVSPIRRRFGFGFCFLGGATLVAFSSILYGIAPAGMFPLSFAASIAFAAPVMILAELLASFGDNLIVINTMSLRQALTPDQLQGRVTAFLQLTIWVLAPVMTAVSTLLAAKVGTTAVLVGVGIISLLLVALGVFTPVRLAHPENA